MIHRLDAEVISEHEVVAAATAPMVFGSQPAVGAISATGIASAFRAYIQPLGDASRPIIQASAPNNAYNSSVNIYRQAKVNNVLYSGFGIYFTQLIEPFNVINVNPVANTYPAQMALGAVIPVDADVAKISKMLGIGVTLNVVVNGDYYKIPDLFMASAVYNQNVFGTTLISNFPVRDVMPINDNANHTMQVYGYREGDESKPWLLQLTYTYVGEKDPVAFAMIDIAPLKPIDYENPEDIFTLFNYKLAMKLLQDPKYDMRRLITSHQTDWPAALRAVPCFKTWGGSAVFDSIKLDVDEPTLMSSSKLDYVNMTTLVNNTDTQLTFKTADYALKITDQTQTKWSSSSKAIFSENVQYKNEIKAKAKIGVVDVEVADSIQITVNAGFEFTKGKETTVTHTDEKTYTVSGQTIVVPPHTTYQLEASWTRASIKGEFVVYYPLTTQPVLQVYFKFQQSNNQPEVNALLNTEVAMKELDIPALKQVDVNKGDIPTKVTCVWGRMPFESDTSVLAGYAIKQVIK